ncbi:MAG: hypothetical protein ABFS28_06795 [Bacteroidota bacterium]
MPGKLGFYELFEPYIKFGLIAQNISGENLRDLRNAQATLTSNFPGASGLLSNFITGILDYLSVEELFSSEDENAIILRGSAKFGGEGRANPNLPEEQAVIFTNGQELRWLDDLMDFRLTVPRRSTSVSFDTSGLNSNEVTDLQQLNDLLNAFDDTPQGNVSDQPGNDFRLELLIRSVRITLPRERFIPARVAADGWLEQDINFKSVVFEFPRLSFVLEQQGEAGNLDFSLKSWDSSGFDDPGDVDTARLFTLTPSYFLHSSKKVGFGIDRLVADFSDNVTPPEILEQFGIGDDFNGFWLPLIQIFIAPGRTTGLAFSARGRDLLYDFDKGISGEFSTDLIHRVGDKLKVEPVFYQDNKKTSLEFKRGKIELNNRTTTVSKGEVLIPGKGEMHLTTQGTDPPYLVSIKFAGVNFPPDLTEGATRPKWIVEANKSGLLEIAVSDNGNRNHWNESIEVKHVVPTGPVPPEKKYRIDFNQGPGDSEYQIELVAEEVEEAAAEFRLLKDDTKPELFKGNIIVNRRADGIYRIPITPGATPVGLEAKWKLSLPPPVSNDISSEFQTKVIKGLENKQTSVIRLYFKLAFPLIPPVSPDDIAKALKEGGESELSSLGLAPPNSFNTSRSDIESAIDNFLENTQGHIFISGFASHEKDRNFQKDPELSALRASTLELMILGRLEGTSTQRTVLNNGGFSHAADKNDTDFNSDERFRVAIAISTPLAETKNRNGEVSLVDITPEPAPPAKVEHPPTPSEPDGPTIFRRVGLRTRFERDKLVLGEISGQFDFNVAADKTMSFVKAAGDPRNNDTDNLSQSIQTAPGASQSGERGILDYRLTISYDTATRRLTEELALGFDQENRDGWVHFEREDPSVLANTIGSLLVFAPLLNAGIDSAVNKEGEEAIADILLKGAAVLTATALGVTGAIKFRKWTLFGIELSSTQLLPDHEAQENTKFGQLSALFDYAVDFEVDIDLGVLKIRSTRINNKPVPIKVRYRGFGFRLNFNTDDIYEPVFDTSKGFELGIAEPGALEVDGPLGPILKILAVRVARQNPFILEFDLGLNANLGVVTVETVRVRIPFEPSGPPAIIPTAISVDIPGAFVGKGYLDIRDSGFTGSIDVTLVPLKLRIQASVGVESLEEANRRITAFFLSLGAEFTAPIPLGGTGLGLYGLLGLFGMHYKRDEEPPVNPNLPVALDWFYHKAKGKPNEIAVDGRPTWVTAPDRWSFGVGVVLGTMEGAFIFNLKGMLVLDLPGPRILIFAKAQILETRPPSGEPADQSAGILAVVDLNFQSGYIAIGLLFTYEIKELLRIEVPIDSRFSFDDIEDWHLHIGSLDNKASADILGISKGTAYLMFDGKGIPDFPLGALHGFSIAAGIAASLVIGNKDSGLYAEVSGALDVGVSTEPLHFTGQMQLEGSIHIWIMSIGASALLTIEAPEPLYVEGEVCGTIDLWLKKLKGCVGFKIGEPHSLPDPTPLITGLSLQSHSPALVEGQATDQPVDTSLGISHHAAEIIEDVPIDVIPVLQMKYPPVFSASSTDLKPASSAPTLPIGSEGWVSLGGLPNIGEGREVRYEIQSITITPALPDGNTDIPVTWWQPARPNAPADSQATDKGVNLALNSWIPVPFPRAYQRSEEQRQVIRDRFEVICKEIAPATSVLWTFNTQQAGISPPGWQLDGITWPDPPNTLRASPPKNRLHIHEPDYPNRDHQLINEWVAMLTGQVYDPARIIPSVTPFGKNPEGKALQFPFLQFSENLIDRSITGDLLDLLNKFLEGAGIRERIVVESGDASQVKMLLCVSMKQKVHSFMFLRTFDNQDQLVEEIKIPGQFIGNFNDLPSAWQDASGPWRKEVKFVFDFLTGTFKGTHQLFLMEWKPSNTFTRFEVFYKSPSPQRNFSNPPPVILGVTEILTRAETERKTLQEHRQQEMVNVVVNALKEGDERPLFAPGTTYTVAVNYTAAIKKTTDAVSSNPPLAGTQSFRFRTTSIPPHRLDPWMLSTLPEKDEKSHFTKDPVQFIFNDSAAIQLFRAYGKTLRAVLRKANGNHPVETPELAGPALKSLPTQLRTPFAQSLMEVVTEMPCIPEVFEKERHIVFSVDIPLERGTEYILDIEADPGTQEDNLLPLFRTSFATSRFRGAKELADEIHRGFIKERRTIDILTLPLKTRTLLIPDDGSPSHTTQVTIECITNAEMESALLVALGSELPPANQPGVTFLWSSTIPATPLAVFIDSSESLLRTRMVPVEVSTPTPDDDAIQHFRNREQLWLELIETSSGLSERIIYTTGGCRLILLLNDNAEGVLQLALRQHRHTLLINDDKHQDFPMIEIPVPAKAPWES